MHAAHETGVRIRNARQTEALCNMRRKLHCFP